MKRARIRISDASGKEMAPRKRKLRRCAMSSVVMAVGDPADEPAPEVHHHADGRAPQPDLLESRRGGVEVRQVEDGRDEVRGKPKQHQPAVRLDDAGGAEL